MIRVVLADDHEIVRSGFRMLLERDPEIRVVGEAADGTQAYDLVAREKPDVILLDISMPPGQSGLVACENIKKDHPGTHVVIVTMFAEPEYLYFTMHNGADGYLLKTASTDELLAAVHAVHEGGTYLHSKVVAQLGHQVEELRSSGPAGRQMGDRGTKGGRAGGLADEPMGGRATDAAPAVVPIPGADCASAPAPELTPVPGAMPGAVLDVTPGTFPSLAADASPVASGEASDDSYKRLTTRELEILRLLARGYTNRQIAEQVYLSVKTVESYRSKIYAKLGFENRAQLVDYAIRHKLFAL